MSVLLQNTTISKEEFQNYLQSCQITKNEEKKEDSSSLSPIVKNSLLVSSASAVLSAVQILDPFVIRSITNISAFYMWIGAVVIIGSAFFIGRVEKSEKKTSNHLNITTSYENLAKENKLLITGMQITDQFIKEFKAFLSIQKNIDIEEKAKQNKTYYASIFYFLSGLSFFLGGILSCSMLTLAGTIAIIANSTYVAYELWEKDQLTQEEEFKHNNFIKKYNTDTVIVPVNTQKPSGHLFN